MRDDRDLAADLAIIEQVAMADAMAMHPNTSTTSTTSTDTTEETSMIYTDPALDAPKPTTMSTPTPATMPTQLPGQMPLFEAPDTTDLVGDDTVVDTVTRTGWDHTRSWRQLQLRYADQDYCVPVTTGHVLAAIDADPVLRPLSGLVTVTGTVLPRWRARPPWRDAVHTTALVTSYDRGRIAERLEEHYFGEPVWPARVDEALARRAHRAAET